MDLPFQCPQIRRNGKEDQEQNQEILGQLWCDCNEVKAGVAFVIRGEGIYEYHYLKKLLDQCIVGVLVGKSWHILWRGKLKHLL
jgi:hypothetical protein